MSKPAPTAVEWVAPQSDCTKPLKPILPLRSLTSVPSVSHEYEDPTRLYLLDRGPHDTTRVAPRHTVPRDCVASYRLLASISKTHEHITPETPASTAASYGG